MKKIFIVTTEHPQNDARIFYREILTLAKKYQVVYLAKKTDKEAPNHNNIQFIELNPRSGLFFRIKRNIKCFSYLVRHRAKIIHLHDFEFLFFAPILKVVNRAIIIFDKHEFIALTIQNRNKIPFFLRPVLLVLIRFFEILFEVFVDEMIVANPIQLKSYPNAMLLMNLPPVENFKKFFVKKNFKKIGYIGDITTSRGGKLMIEIINKLPKDYHLYLAGNIREKELKRDIESNKKISHLGYLENKDIVNNFSDVGIGLIPFLDREQYRLSVPSKYFDYLGMGMVIVAPGFIKKSFGENFCFGDGVIFLENLSPDFFAKKIEKTTEEEFFKKSKYNREAFNLYNWSNEAKKLMRVYEKYEK